jgi:D-xylose transport system substrate-binding protein
VGVILPDTESSVRWESFDRPYLGEAFEEAGVEYDIQNAEGDAQRQATIAEQMITEGATVLAIVNLDSASGAQIQEQAAAEGVQTIDYDRLTLGGSAEYYVSFDNTAVGRLQGEGLAQCLEEQGVTEGNIAFLNGSPDDNNATLFSQGAHEVLDPLSQYTQVAEQAVPEWDNQEAATIFEQMYTQAGGDIQGVLAANDGLANSVIQILERNNAAGIPVTGQDATVEGLQNILAGNQCMTVYKSVRDEANALAELAVALLNGEEGETTGEVEDTEAGRQVPSVLLEPQAIFRDNVIDVVEDDFVSAEDLCTGEFAEACTELGIE